MPRSCPCRTCERLNGAEAERIRRNVIFFPSGNQSSLGCHIHNLPIARRLFSRNFKKKSNLTRWLFLLFVAVLKFWLNFLRWLPLFPCFSLVMSFPTLFTSFLFSHMCLLSEFFPLLKFFFWPYFFYIS